MELLKKLLVVSLAAAMFVGTVSAVNHDELVLQRATKSFKTSFNDDQALVFLAKSIAKYSFCGELHKQILERVLTLSAELDKSIEADLNNSNIVIKKETSEELRLKEKTKRIDNNKRKREATKNNVSNKKSKTVTTEQNIASNNDTENMSIIEISNNTTNNEQSFINLDGTGSDNENDNPFNADDNTLGFDYTNSIESKEQSTQRFVLVLRSKDPEVNNTINNNVNVDEEIYGPNNVIVNNENINEEEEVVNQNNNIENNVNNNNDIENHIDNLNEDQSENINEEEEVVNQNENNNVAPVSYWNLLKAVAYETGASMFSLTTLKIAQEILTYPMSLGITGIMVTTGVGTMTLAAWLAYKGYVTYTENNN